MGGFLLSRREAGEDAVALERRLAPALAAFDRKGLRPGPRLLRDGFVLQLYGKLREAPAPVLDLPGGDFIALTGTAVYRGRRGPEALRALHDDFLGGVDFTRELYGAYCAFVHHGGELQVFTDHAGYYPVYRDRDFRVLSSSFLATAALAGKRTVSAHEFYEYLFFGFFFHHRTLFEEVALLDNRRIWRLTPELDSRSYAPDAGGHPAPLPFADQVAAIADNLCDYFRILGGAFDGRFTTALSGGYDSRLVLAVARKLGLRVDLYVYGSPGDADVRIARRVAEGESLALDHVDKDAFPEMPREDYPDHLGRQFHFFDAFKSFGVFDNGSDLETRLRRTASTPLQVGGAGGEIYREIWNVSDRRIGIRDFVATRYCHGDYSYCTDRFREERFHDALADKVRDILQTDRDRMDRRQLEMLFPLLRNRFAAQNNAINNQVASAVLPFMEARFLDQSYRVPIAYKYFGRLEAALIHRLDPALAAYPSNYGPNFTAPPSAARRLKTLATMHLPLAVRRARRRRRAPAAPTPPYYLRRDYLAGIVDFADPAVGEFVDLDRLHDPLRLSRALTVELLLSDRF